MKGTGAKRNVCLGSCVSTGAKFPVAPVESAPMCPLVTDKRRPRPRQTDRHRLAHAVLRGKYKQDVSGARQKHAAGLHVHCIY